MLSSSSAAFSKLSPSLSNILGGEDEEDEEEEQSQSNAVSIAASFSNRNRRFGGGGSYHNLQSGGGSDANDDDESGLRTDDEDGEDEEIAAVCYHDECGPTSIHLPDNVGSSTNFAGPQRNIPEFTEDDTSTSLDEDAEMSLIHMASTTRGRTQNGPDCHEDSYTGDITVLRRTNAFDEEDEEEEMEDTSNTLDCDDHDGRGGHGSRVQPIFHPVRPISRRNSLVMNKNSGEGVIRGANITRRSQSEMGPPPPSRPNNLLSLMQESVAASSSNYQYKVLGRQSATPSPLPGFSEPQQLQQQEGQSESTEAATTTAESRPILNESPTLGLATSNQTDLDLIGSGRMSPVRSYSLDSPKANLGLMHREAHALSNNGSFETIPEDRVTTNTSFKANEKYDGDLWDNSVVPLPLKDLKSKVSDDYRALQQQQQKLQLPPPLTALQSKVSDEFYIVSEKKNTSTTNSSEEESTASYSLFGRLVSYFASLTPAMTFSFISMTIGHNLHSFQSMYLLNDMGWDEAAVGAAFSILGFSSLIFSVWVGNWVDQTRFDLRMVLKISIVITALCTSSIMLVRPGNKDHTLVYVTKLVEGISENFLDPCKCIARCNAPSLYMCSASN